MFGGFDILDILHISFRVSLSIWRSTLQSLSFLSFLIGWSFPVGLFILSRDLLFRYSFSLVTTSLALPLLLLLLYLIMVVAAFIITCIF